MHWRHKKVTYDILIPELDKDIFQLDEKEAASYFQWFIERIPERVSYVSEVCAKELRVSVEKMDCSPESLLLLWKWFRRKARTELVVCTDEKSDTICDNRRQLTLETEYILRDVGMYLGETFKKNNPQIYWTYYTKPHRDFFVNHPLLKGFVDRTFGKPFEACFEPIHMAHVQAARILDKTSKNEDLFNIYSLWIKKT